MPQWANGFSAEHVVICGHIRPKQTQATFFQANLSALEVLHSPVGIYWGNTMGSLIFQETVINIANELKQLYKVVIYCKNFMRVVI